ncbi:MAG TPA: NAD(P)-binding domain-containing protein [Thermoanaerobaculia bacterium]|nr:NAD(P)-binding domain-containing protein [Thermoanaerobaculia bacterium]
MNTVVSFGGNVDYEYLILGAGPAGLQMGHHLSHAGHTYLILEAGDCPGHFFKTFPRHRTLISSNKVYTGSEDPEVNLRFDWNSLLSEGDGRLLFKEYSRRYFPPADELVRYLGDYADFHELNVRCNTNIVRVEKPRPHMFRLTDAEGKTFTSRRLIVATGVSKPYVPGIPGVELAENYVDVSVDPEDFANQRVLILGKGNSAFETADNLIPTTALLHVASPNPLRLAWKTHFMGNLRAVNNNFLDTYQLKTQNAVLDCTVDKIERQGEGYAVSVRYSHAHGETERLTYDRVIVCTGFRFDDSIFSDECRPELVINNRFPAQMPDWESINVPGLYFAGTLMQANDFKKHTSGFIHGFRYNVRSLFRILEKKYHHRDWPARDVEPTPDGLVEATLARVNRTSALWQQFGFLHDVIVVDEDWNRALYYEELPLAYIHSSEIGNSQHYYTVTLEFGKVEGDPFAIVRNPEPSKADESVDLHPVIRRWCGRQLISECHLLENLFGEWAKADAHVAPLRFFFMEQLLEMAEMNGLHFEDQPQSAPQRSLLRSVAV